MSTRLNVLKVLEEKKGQSVSGEELAKILSVSRAAIWKAINELRKEGYNINAVTNKGYSLAIESDVLSAEGILPYIESPNMDGRIFVYKSVDSTNQTAKKLALEGGAAGTVVVAEEQTSGKGRMGRSFFSPAGSGIYMSIILNPTFLSSKAVLITTAASVAVCRAIEGVTGIDCQIKWVNDIYAGNKKVCGILTEAVTDFETGHIEYIILGIGINFSTSKADFPLEIKEKAGSLYENQLKGSSRNRLIAEVIKQVLMINENIESKNFINEYKKRSLVLGKKISVLPPGLTAEEKEHAAGTSAIALDIDSDGGLVVQYDSGIVETLHSGEISIRI